MTVQPHLRRLLRFADTSGAYERWGGSFGSTACDGSQTMPLAASKDLIYALTQVTMPVNVVLLTS
jgi:hypothetical protein